MVESGYLTMGTKFSEILMNKSIVMMRTVRIHS